MKSALWGEFLCAIQIAIIIKQKEVFMMTDLEEFSKFKERFSTIFKQKICQLSDVIFEQMKYLDIYFLSYTFDRLSVTSSD
jgi:hypothetical protein